MSAKFYTLLTDIGAAKLASAAALGVPLKITQMAVGDGGGVLPTPSAQQTALVAEKRRASLNMLYIDPQNSSQIIAEQVIPETEGGWWIREVGLFDETGALIAVGNCPESYKPQLAEGSGRTQTVRMVLITSSTDNITLKIDPSVVLATRKYVDDKVLELKVYVDDLMAKHLAEADPHTQYATKESPTLTGTPKAPTAPAGTNTTQIASTAFVQAVVTALNNALALKAPLASPSLTGTPTAPTAAQTVNNTQIATTAFVKSAIAALVASSPAALDTLNELAEALGNDPNFATTMTNALAGKQPLDATLTSLSGKSISGLLQYLQLGEAAKRDVGTGENQIPDMSSFVFSVSGGVNIYRFPNRMCIQWGNSNTDENGGAIVSLPVAMSAYVPVVIEGLSGNWAGNGGVYDFFTVYGAQVSTASSFLAKSSSYRGSDGKFVAQSTNFNWVVVGTI
ncbi:phage tail protein [Citrobacter braakii]|uniref:phage tail protein n=1 Tax=Citrobacter braakii TaxID=57706 RepID=UPI002B2554B8|nr:phage tail protein [Citrobacter braakii]MEB0955140.1 phage tail protein [Citrobacter braakii]MEB0984964.1 phage tail protein [Citrobacter braakii]